MIKNLKLKISNYYNFLPFSRFIVSGHSMLPVLKPGQNVLTFNWAYVFSNPKMRDIIVFKQDTQIYIKRVQEINGSKVYVVGDNQTDSEDSRKFGTIDKTQIIGKVVYFFIDYDKQAYFISRR